MGFLVLILFFAGFVFIEIKISNLKHRAKQHVLKNTGISSSDIDAGIDSTFEKKHLENFLSDYPNFTEESIKALLKKYTEEFFNKNMIEEFGEKVYKKIQNDSKLEKMQTMEFRRVSFKNYNKFKLYAEVVYTDNKDEYEVFLICSILEGKIQLDDYTISKGAVVGF